LIRRRTRAKLFSLNTLSYLLFIITVVTYIERRKKHVYHLDSIDEIENEKIYVVNIVYLYPYGGVNIFVSKLLLHTFRVSGRFLVYIVNVYKLIEFIWNMYTSSTCARVSA